MNQIGVYKITSSSGNFYVGMTCDSFQARWYGHHKDLRRGVHRCAGLQRAYAKYGWDSFKIEILEAWDKPEDLTGMNLLGSWIQQREQYWWDYFVSNGEKPYHGRPTGTGSVFHTKETRTKIGTSNPNRLMGQKRSCPMCETSFQIKRGRQEFCSTTCARKISPGNKLPTISKEVVEELYLVRRLSKQKAADLLGIHRNSFGNLLIQYGIPIRSMKDAQLVRFS